ncbi:phosphate ABC transporter permease PstA [Xanthomonas euvesicatoria]|jgi:phosphate transport system permease protein|uniref:Phosphate transport system permease protein PstA n=3 Tax=Stenotrophomonas TaxID=40323 RepID=A0AAI9G0D2_STEMA|nr:MULTISPECIES: phosphate ABC transporter permease PstA [Xanthomonadaceae]OZB67384.1 MAG: phosphate ABC transporter, permease protein PstA [Xanthomonadales bacterium 14-68-21]EKT4441690.1 phosphate ABC transporter permease PstA [Stenotrophomonas maltophilia]MBA0432488.1 phosphate ABC transporter permease PstA [Stenotrophomonas maltophilia]MBN4953042.1 phosphate ABC transporter permease PstA [Stenotrophomonas maltophilia]MBN5011912.1 phosphate ABC transporter permease PstA [Stenotrophomonas ma
MRDHIEPMGLDDAAITRRARVSDLCFTVLGLLVLFLTLTILMALVADFVVDGAARLTPDFFTNFPSRRPESAGILSAWIGTCLVMLVTGVLAVPVGVAAGVYLEEYAPKHWVTDFIEVNVTNLAGVPSIIFGLLALGLFVQMFGLGQTILVAGMTLALLILPIIIVATRESLRAIPQDIREAAFGLGADQWQTVSIFLLPAARPGILTGAIVGMSRAIGETAPIITIGALTFIAFLPPSPIQASAPFISFEWLSSPFTVMPIQMFNWVSRPQAGFHVNAAAAGLVLLGMTLLMNGFAIWLRYRLRRRLR